MPSEIDWENEVDFKKENEVDEDIEEVYEEEPEEDEDFNEDEEELEEDEDFNEDEEELEEDEDFNEDEEEPEEEEDFNEDEEEPEEDEDFDENEEKYTDKTALFIDGILTDYRYAEKIEKAALEQGNLQFAKLYHVNIEKYWNKTIESFTVDSESIVVDFENKNEQMKNSIISYCDNIDIVCICTNAGFFEEVINELKAMGKKVVLISTWAASSNKLCKASDLVVRLNTAKNEETKKHHTAESVNRAALFIDGTLADYRYAEEIEKAALKQGDLQFAKIYRIDNEKNWNKTIESFTVDSESIVVDAADKNEQIKNSIISYCDDIDIFCICTNANFFREVIKELKSLGKKVVIISTWALSSSKLGKVSDSVIQLNNAPVQSNKNTKTETPLVSEIPNGVLYIDGNSISPKRAKQILEFAKTKGNVKFICVFTVKGNDKAKKWKKRAEKLGIQNICLDKGTRKSDFAEIMGEEMSFKIDGNDFLCLAADNAVFGKKVKEIHKSGKKVVILSEREVSPELFKICDEIYDLKNNQIYPNYEYAYKKCAINAVLFIDGENIPHDYANLILSKAWEQGNLNLNIGGVYCREEDPGTKPWKLKAEVFRLKTNQLKGKAAKNKVDNAIIADALKCMEENDNITTFCIASHDKDYAKTVVKLRKAGKRVCVIGKLNMVSDEMRFICDEFIPIGI